MSNSATAALIVALGFCVGYWTQGYFTKYRVMRIRRRVGCLFGRHTAGPVRDEVGGRRVQRCDWCDKVVREYAVTFSNINKEKIRRIY